ncbi:hypothetical protein CANMA_002470 [Candida margitis]|uniref:uncharacterized protein n=1 Tax=Candida margitis TaxID=1775924 RepID=UPI0022280586|nr:uncharacterized protein CANMA_002470 [Candida margitis]KAI5968254.1 hypothetical protein CANMA_002470 [Candida margitis]
MSRVNKNWNTLYSYSQGIIYLHLKNNDLLQLRFDLNGSFTEGNNLENNQQVTTLTPPPDNSTLFILNDTLYGLKRSDFSQDSDICGDGSFSIIKYDNDLWDNEIELDFDKVADSSFYQYSTILTKGESSDLLYVYGGLCGQTNESTNRLVSVNITSGQVNNITTSTKPQPFYGASNILAPNVQSQLVIGGESNSGWLNMYQLATWDFDSGWSFKQVDKVDDTTVNSRTFPLILPLFKPFTASGSISDNFRLDQVLMIGGDIAGEESTPKYAKLQMDSNSWNWNVTEADNFQLDEVLGAATIFSTLVVINSTRDLKEKRMVSQGYQVNLYDVDTFESVSNIKENTTPLESTSDTNTSHSSNNKEKIILGTVLPIFFVSLISGLLVFFYIYKRKKSKSQEQNPAYNEIDYKFDYVDPPSSFSGDNHHLSPPYVHDNDSNSTLSGAASIDSWMKKRQDFDRSRLRNSYLASNDTLQTIDDEMSHASADDKEVEGEEEEQEETAQVKSVRPSLDPNNPFVHKSVRNLQKSFSFSHTPPTSPILKKEPPKLKSKRLTKTEHLVGNALIDDGSEGDGDLANEVVTPNIERSSDVTSIDDKMDVQVLVSSKRRSILKIMNPDDANEEGEEASDTDSHQPVPLVQNGHPEDTTNEYEVNLSQDNAKSEHGKYTGLRQRVPSGSKE